MFVRTLCVAVIVFLIGVLAYISQPRLQVINLQGDIDAAMATQVMAQVRSVNGDPSVKAVLLVVKSYGGTVLASAEIYDELSKIKVLVVAWCDDICDSGGVYVLSATSVKFVALNSGATNIGSIGVITKYERPNELCEDCTITIYKSGALKQAGAPDHEPTAVEKAYLQSEVDEMAQTFYSVVAKARGAKISPASWVKIKTARLFFGQGGIDVGLADQIMDRDAAIAKAEALAGAGHLLVQD